MPVGEFREMVKDLNKKNRGKPLAPHTVWIEKKVTNSYVTSLTVSVASKEQSLDAARVQLDQVEFPIDPTWSNQVTYSYSTVEPMRWRR